MIRSLDERGDLDSFPAEKGSLSLMDFRVFVQARMSSSRFPGKVLAPLRGRPLIDHLIGRILRDLGKERIVVATSSEASDEPLVAYLQQIGIEIFRGPLDDVFRRFQRCLHVYPCAWFFRVCGDSPCLNTRLFQQFLEKREDAVDLVTNTQRRTFPKGQSVELVNSKTFAAIAETELSPEQREHVTKIFYDRPQQFKIINVESGDPKLAAESWVVDTLEDLRRLENASWN